MTCHGSTQRNKPREPRPCGWLTPDTLTEIAAYLVRRFETERRRQRRAHLFIQRETGAVFVLAEDCALVEAWVRNRLPDYVGCYFAGRPNRGTANAAYDMPPTLDGLVEDLADHMGF